MIQGYLAYTHRIFDDIQCLFFRHQWRFTSRNDQGGEGKSDSIRSEEAQTLGYSWTLPITKLFTENINVCVSDLFQRALIVTDTFGEQRFSYEGKTETWFLPNAVVTYMLGHIIVCDGYENTVHLLDSDSQFLDFFSKQRSDS